MSRGTITLYVATSLDGYIADPDGGVGWLEAFDEEPPPDDPDGYEAFFASVDALVMGSTTYEQILGFGDWPYGKKAAYVLTTRDLPLAHENIECLQGDVEHLSKRLREAHEHLWLVGGANTAQRFLATDQLDEIRLTLAPILLGGGIPLFHEGTTHKLELLKTKPFTNGLVELRYAVP